MQHAKPEQNPFERGVYVFQELVHNMYATAPHPDVIRSLSAVDKRDPKWLEKFSNALRDHFDNAFFWFQGQFTPEHYHNNREAVIYWFLQAERQGGSGSATGFLDPDWVREHIGRLAQNIV